MRIANQGDALSMDPHSLNESLQLSVTGNVYEPLVGRNKDLTLAPALATSWKQTSPTVWRFELRKGVQFHDGTPVHGRRRGVLASRAPQVDGSDMKSYTNDVKEVRKIDDHTVEIETKAPFPILPDVLSQRLHHEQEVVRGEPGHPPGRPPQGHRERRLLPRQRHRPVPPARAPAGRAHRPSCATATTGARSKATCRR